MQTYSGTPSGKVIFNQDFIATGFHKKISTSMMLLEVVFFVRKTLPYMVVPKPKSIKNTMEQVTNSVQNFKVAEIEVHYKTKGTLAERPVITSAQLTYEILCANWNVNTIEYREEFKVILLNRASRVLGIMDISQGGVASTSVDAKMIFGASLKANASSIIVAHNHPSGNLTPSESDKRLTEKLKNGAKLLDLRLLDHIIITREGYYSFSDNGIL